MQQIKIINSGRCKGWGPGKLDASSYPHPHPPSTPKEYKAQQANFFNLNFETFSP